MFRIVYSLVVAVFLIPVPAKAGSGFEGAFRLIPDHISKTCNHYINRARFKERGPNAEFDVILADACRLAIADRYARIHTAPVTNKRAEQFLIRLSEFKETIISINMERAFGRDYSPWSKPVGAMTEQWGIHRTGVRPVSQVGEYLIAREMGLTELLRQWAYAGGVKTARLN